MLSATWLNYWGFLHINSRLVIFGLLGGLGFWFFFSEVEEGQVQLSEVMMASWKSSGPTDLGLSVLWLMWQGDSSKPGALTAALGSLCSMSALCLFSFFFAFTACCALASFFYLLLPCLLLNPHQYSPNSSQAHTVLLCLQFYLILSWSWCLQARKVCEHFLFFWPQFCRLAQVM